MNANKTKEPWEISPEMRPGYEAACQEIRTLILEARLPLSTGEEEVGFMFGHDLDRPDECIEISYWWETTAALEAMLSRGSKSVHKKQREERDFRKDRERQMIVKLMWLLVDRLKCASSVTLIARGDPPTLSIYYGDFAGDLARDLAEQAARGDVRRDAAT